MRYQLIVLAALSLEYAVAQPAHHRHHHKARRTWEDVDFEHKTDYDFSGVDFTKVDYNAGKAAAGGPAPSPAANPVTVPVEHNKAADHESPKVIDVIPVPAESDKNESKQNNDDSENSDGQSTDTSSGSSETTSGVTGGAKGSFGGRTPGRAGATEDQYHGNVGVPYGSNMMAISTGDIDKYKYTNTFKNTGSNPLTIQIWNKGGRDGAAQSGMGEEPNMMFTVQPGQSQTVAFDENTTAAFSRKCDRSTKSNIPMCVWGEITFGCEMPAVGDKKASDKWSGFNRSSIPAGANEILTITCTSCDAKAREETKSGKGQNTWETAGDPFHKNGVSPGIAHLLTEMAY
ncbi:MAG: hypothetical protein L6R38_004779 [Xanthoria sp. 2 TBL-2021]|nr:MAG: hypothetical protein L6R38_004779 [Xanthoria sp. 2 TBL-2021]